MRNLGVLFDSELSMKQHVAKVAATCFYYLHRLRQIRRRVGAEVTTQLVLAFITSRLDYCNSILAGVPQSTLEPLQQVQYAAVRLNFQLGKGNMFLQDCCSYIGYPYVGAFSSNSVR